MSMLDGLGGGFFYSDEDRARYNRQMNMQTAAGITAAQLSQMVDAQRQAATATKHSDVIDGEYEVVTQQTIEHREADDASR